jgi:hypothetical protein
MLSCFGHIYHNLFKVQREFKPTIYLVLEQTLMLTRENPKFGDRYP